MAGFRMTCRDHPQSWGHRKKSHGCSSLSLTCPCCIPLRPMPKAFVASAGYRSRKGWEHNGVRVGRTGWKHVTARGRNGGVSTMGLLSTASDLYVSDAAQLTRNTYASLPSQLDPICSLTRVLIPRIWCYTNLLFSRRRQNSWATVMCGRAACGRSAHNVISLADVGGGVVGWQQDYVHVTEVLCTEWRCSLCGYSTMGGAALCMDIALRVVLLFIWI